MDFEGEPARALSERKLKRFCLRDVAGMIRSFHYAVRASLKDRGASRPEDLPLLEPWTEPWYEEMSEVYLSSYLSSMAGSPALPHEPEEVRLLLDAFILDKALYELLYELNHRPDWVDIPLSGLLRTLGLPAAEVPG